jgi:hypothetical protein
MVMSYATLAGAKSAAGSIRNWINKGDVDPDTILEDAQTTIYLRLRHWRMKTEATGTMSIGTDSITLPTDFIEERSGIWITGVYRQKLLKADEDKIQSMYDYDSTGARITGQPNWFYISGSSAKFDYVPDQAYPYLLPYYAQPALLSNSNQTNFLTTFAPRLLRSACMLAACEWVKEVGQGQFDRTYWQQQVDGLLGAFQGASDLATHARDTGAEFDE